MFNDIFTLSVKRTPLQSLGFYIAYLIMLLLVCGIAGAIAGVLTGGGFHMGVKIGQMIAIIVCPALGFFVLKGKRAFSFGNVLIALLAGILAALGGGILGLIPVSFLTTKPIAMTPGNEQ
jgi:hypothetical protein